VACLFGTQIFDFNGSPPLFGFIHLVKLYINYGKEYVRFRSYLKKTFYGKYIYSFFQARLSQANSQNIFEQTKIGVTLTFGHFIPNANAIFLILPINIRRFN
jgi:hypothetical protein